MRCPWCPCEAPPRALHAHLLDSHGGKVTFDERGEARWYALECPICGEGYEHQVKPRLRDAAFMEEFQREIRLVAFDMLVNHLLVEHESDAETEEEAL